MLGDLTQFLLDAFDWVCNLFLSLLMEFLNLIIVTLVSFLKLIVEMFPDSEPIFTNPPEGLLEIAGLLNWFVPMDTISLCASAIASAYLTHSGLRPLLKFFRMS